MELYKGRPSDESGRAEKEIKVYDMLDELGVSYERADHEAVMTIAACEEVDEALGVAICKNLFLCNRQKTYCCFRERKRLLRKSFLNRFPHQGFLLLQGRTWRNI